MFFTFPLKSWHIDCKDTFVIKNVMMIINCNSLCNTCLHASSCNLTSNKNFIWSCSEYEEETLKNTNLTSILTPNFSFTESEKGIEII